MELSEKIEEASTCGGAGAVYSSENVKRARLNSTLAALLDDPVLADVPKNPTLSDVDTLISLELGSAMRISLLKPDSSFGILSFLFCIFTINYLGLGIENSASGVLFYLCIFTNKLKCI